MVFEGPHAPPVPFTRILAALSKRLAALADIARDLEDVTNPRAHPIGPNDLIRNLQNVDTLRQALDDLTSLTDALGQKNPAEAIDADTISEIVGTLSLAATKAIVATSQNQQSGEDGRNSAGEPLLFSNLHLP